MREVAVHAQVSVGIVSNALNRPHVVAQTTLERVQAAIEELGFVRNDLARQLRMGGGKALGMIILNMANPFFAGLAQACETAAGEVGYTAQLGSSDQLRERENRYVDLFEEQRVGGMMIAPFDGATAHMRRVHDRGMGMVLFDACADESEFCTVELGVIVRQERLFKPTEAKRFQRPGQRCGVVDVERHPAVVEKRKIGSDLFARNPRPHHISTEAFLALARSPDQR